MNDLELDLRRRLTGLGNRYASTVAREGLIAPAGLRKRIVMRQLGIGLTAAAVLMGALVGTVRGFSLNGASNQDVVSSVPEQEPVSGALLDPGYRSPQGWPVVEFEDPEGPFVDGDLGEEEIFAGQREVLVAGRVHFEGRSLRWSYSTFTIKPDLDVKALSRSARKSYKRLDSPAPGSVCVEYQDLEDDGSGGGSVACGDDLLGEGAFTNFTISSDAFPELPFYLESSGVPGSTDRVTIEIEDEDSYDLPLVAGPDGSNLAIFIGFIPRTGERATIRTFEGHRVTSEYQICTEPNFLSPTKCERA